MLGVLTHHWAKAERVDEAKKLLVYRTRFPGHQRGMSGYGFRGDRRSWRDCAIAFSA